MVGGIKGVMNKELGFEDITIDLDISWILTWGDHFFLDITKDVEW